MELLQKILFIIIISSIIVLLFIVADCNTQAINNSNNYIVVTDTELKNNPEIYNNKKIIINGEYSSGFEVSSLNNHIWINSGSNSKVYNSPDKIDSYKHYKVLVMGTFINQSGSRYGHLGAYDSQINFEIMVYQ